MVKLNSNKFSKISFFIWAMAAFFIIGSVGNFMAPPSVAADYARWGYPDWFHYVTAGLELLTAILLLVRKYGIIFGAMVMLSAGATLIYYQEYQHALAPALILALLGLLFWMTSRSE